MRYWKRVDAQGKTTTVESYSHDLDVDGAVEISEKEFNDYIASLPTPVLPPVRDLAAEIDQIKTDIQALKTKIGTK
jgi:hypothetical protein